MRHRHERGPGCVSGATRGRIQSYKPNPIGDDPDRQSKSTDRAARAYAAGDRGAARCVDVADRFCSALFHAASGESIPDFSDYTIPVDAMPTAPHRAALRSLIGYIESGVAPTVTGIRSVMRALGVVDDELPELLPVCESSAAGIHNWGAALIRADRRRRQIARLWRALTDRSDDPTAPAYGTKPARIVARVRGKGARR